VKKTMTLGLIVLATVACDNRRRGGPEVGPSPTASPADAAPATASPAPPPAAAGFAATARGNQKIDVKLKMRSGRCVVEDPGRTTVRPGDSVRWKFKNGCTTNKKQRITRQTAPISGDCDQDTDVPSNGEKEGKDCKVADDAQSGTYKYKIDGDVGLDPELDIPPPPPPQAQPTPSPK
jgi:hypothetical protein